MSITNRELRIELNRYPDDALAEIIIVDGTGKPLRISSVDYTGKTNRITIEVMTSQEEK